MKNDTYFFKARTNAGALQLLIIWVFCVILIASSIGILASLGVSSDVYGWIGPIGVLFGITLTIIMAFRRYYIHYNGTILTAQRPFRTVRKIINPTGHIWGTWNSYANHSNQSYTAGSMVSIDCDKGKLTIGCNDFMSVWSEKTKGHNFSMPPQFIISLDDFGRLLASLNIIDQEELQKFEGRSKSIENMLLNKAATRRDLLSDPQK